MMESVLWGMYSVVGVLFAVIVAIVAMGVVIAGVILGVYILMNIATGIVFVVGVLCFWIADAWRWAKSKRQPQKA